ncbi:MAG: zf-HC2 domain-containing protein [Armatimonadota bacterium]
MTCDECRDRLTELLEGELTPGVHSAMQSHLAACPACARALAEMRAVVAVVHELPEVEPPAEVREALRRIPDLAAPVRPLIWRRVSYAAASLAAAAVAFAVIWTGMAHYRPDGTGAVAPAAPPLVSQRPGAETGAMPGAPERAPEPAKALETTSAPVGETPVGVAGAEDRTGGAADLAPERRRHGREAGGREEAAGGARAHEGSAFTVPSPVPEVAPAPAPAALERSEPDVLTHTGSGERSPLRSRVGTGGAALIPAQAGSRTGPDVAHEMETGPAGPAGPAPGADAAARGMVAEPLAMPEAQYLSAEGSATVTASETGEGSPFVVSFMPPHLRVAGSVVPATITVETEKDVARVQVAVRGTGALELVGAGEDGLLYDGPLSAGQKQVLSVRMLARQPGQQSLTIRLRSTDPVVDTRLAVRMGEFPAPTDPALRSVTFAFTDTPLRGAVEEIVRQSGLRVRIDAAAEARAVTISAPDPIPAGAALRSVAAAAGCTVREVEDELIVEPQED